MPITSKDIHSKLSLYPFQAENLKLLKRPQVDSNGYSTSELIFEIPIELDPKLRKLNANYYVNGWRDMTAKQMERIITDRKMVTSAYRKAKQGVRASQTNKVKYFERLTRNFTEEVPRLETCLFTLYGYVLSKDVALAQKENLDDINRSIADELLMNIRSELTINGLGNSYLLRDLNVTPMITSEIRQLKGSRSKFKIRTGVRLHMWAYGFMRDMGRSRTKPGKTIPYGAIADWCHRYGVTPNAGQSFEQMVHSIINKINKHGYKPNWFLHDAIRNFALSGLTEYLFWKPLATNLEERIKKTVETTGGKYRGWRMSVGDYVLTTSS